MSDREGWINRKRRKPRVFVSYRHSEAEGAADADIINTAHKAFVERLVDDLRDCAVEVVWDRDMQAVLATRSDIDPQVLPFSAEISAICPLICHAFLPVLTPRYCERIGIVGGREQGWMSFGGVLEEWMTALRFISARVIEPMPIVRSGEPNDFTDVPFVVTRRGIYDMRPQNAAHYDGALCQLVGYLHYERRSEHPAADYDLSTWIDLYAAWCRLRYESCARLPLAAWAWRTDRPLEFISEFIEVLSPSSDDPSAAEIYRAFEVRAQVPKPHNWSEAIGLGLLGFGPTGMGTAHLQSIIEAYHAAIGAGAVTPSGKDWGTDQANLGRAHLMIAQHASDPTHVRQSLVAFRAALGVFSSSDTPAEWAAAMTELGRALTETSRHDDGLDGLTTAINVFDRALAIRTRESNAVLWAQTQLWRADAAQRLSARSGSGALAADAEVRLRDCLDVFAAVERPVGQPLLRQLWSIDEAIALARRLLDQSDQNMAPR